MKSLEITVLGSHMLLTQRNLQQNTLMKWAPYLLIVLDFPELLMFCFSTQYFYLYFTSHCFTYPLSFNFCEFCDGPFYGEEDIDTQQCTESFVYWSGTVTLQAVVMPALFCQSLKNTNKINMLKVNCHIFHDLITVRSQNKTTVGTNKKCS